MGQGAWGAGQRGRWSRDRCTCTRHIQCLSYTQQTFIQTIKNVGRRVLRTVEGVAAPQASLQGAAGQLEAAPVTGDLSTPTNTHTRPALAEMIQQMHVKYV